jgi:hypothetical protein
MGLHLARSALNDLKEERMRFTRLATAAVASAVIAGCAGLNQRNTTVESGGDVAGSTGVTPANNRTLPAGARLTATLDQSLGTRISKAGDAFTATVTQALYASDGSIVIPVGAKLEGRVTALDDSDNATEPALIRLAFDRIRFSGNSYPFSASLIQSSPVQTSQASSGDRTRQIVIGGAVGAALGGLLSGGDLDKIVIGGAIGAAAGSIVSLGTEVNATLPAGSQMTVQATQAVSLR